MYFKGKRKREEKKKNKKTNLDNVPKTEDERLLNLIASYLGHIKLYRDDSSKGLKSNKAV